MATHELRKDDQLLARVYDIDDYITFLQTLKEKGYTKVINSYQIDGQGYAPTERNPNFRVPLALDSRVFKNAKPGEYSLGFLLDFHKMGDIIVQMQVFVGGETEKLLNLPEPGQKIDVTHTSDWAKRFGNANRPALYKRLAETLPMPLNSRTPLEAIHKPDVNISKKIEEEKPNE